MPFTATVYRVFFAGPGGLQPERQVFRETVQEYNETDALPQGMMFLPVGWEDTLAGVGRPQAIINEEIRRSDFMILMLWDRWGTRPDTVSKYTSGTEEEFAVAMECFERKEMPMRQIVAFFKAVDPTKLSDQGPQLQKVLQFKKTLESRKSIYFTTFDETAAFQKHLRQHLAFWKRGHESGHTIRHAFSTSVSLYSEVTLPTFSTPVPTQLVQQAKRLANDGRLTEAEDVFARAITVGTDPYAFAHYGDYLLTVGRLLQAQVMYERVRELANLYGDDWRALAYGRLGLLHKTKGNLKDAEDMFREALALQMRLHDDKGIAEQYTNLGIILKRRGNLDDAELMQRQALEIYEQLRDDEGIAIASANMGIVLRKKGRIDEAESFLNKCLQLSSRIGSQLGLARAYGNLGLIHQQRGKLDLAEEAFQRSLATNKRIGSVEGVAIQYANLGLIALERQNTPQAVRLLEQALELNEALGSHNRLANIHYRLGLAYEAMGDATRAITAWNTARDLFIRMSLLHRAAQIQEHLNQLESTMLPEPDVNSRPRKRARGGGRMAGAAAAQTKFPPPD
jgi:tetratricopeptide (TPR) repeat protein